MHSPLRVLSAGPEAVFLFFVLSGVVLALPPLGRPRYAWLAYYPSRLLRLYLPVWSSLLVAYILKTVVDTPSKPDPSYFVRVHEGQYSFGTVVHDAVLLLGTSELNGPLWSLRWELLFSLLLPVYVWLARRVQNLVPIAGVLVVAGCAGAEMAGLDVLAWLPMFALGVLLAVRLRPIEERLTRTASRRWSAWGWPAVLGLCILGITARYTVSFAWPPAARLVYLGELPGAVGLIVVSLGWPAAGRLLVSRPVQRLGTLSFSLYLTHEPLVLVVTKFLPLELRWLVTPIAVPVALVFAEIFYRFAERPSHRLSQRVRRRLATERPDTTRLTSRPSP